MRVLKYYVLRECVFPFFLALGVLTCIFLLGNLVQLANLVINKGVSLSLIGQVFLLYVPLLLGYTLPIACLISVILAFSRLSADNEIVAMRACGIHLKKILFPLFALGIILSLFTLLLNDKLVPYAHHEQRKILKNLGVKNPTALLEAGVFIESFKDQILFIHKIEENRMYGITIYQPQENRPTRTIIAKRGEFTPVPGGDQVKLKLMEGTADEPDLENPNNFYKVNFQNYFMTLDLTNKKKEVTKKPKSMTLKELKDMITDYQMRLLNTDRLETEYWRKITWSFSVLFFILLGFPIAVITHKREKSANVILAILFAGSYYLLSMGCESLAREGIAPAQLIMWIPNLLAAIAAFILNYKLCVK